MGFRNPRQQFVTRVSEEQRVKFASYPPAFRSVGWTLEEQVKRVQMAREATKLVKMPKDENLLLEKLEDLAMEPPQTEEVMQHRRHLDNDVSRQEARQEEKS